MRISFTAALTALMLFAFSTASTQAQNPAGANASKYHVAVVDVGYIFKEHTRFRATMDGMKKEMESIEEQLKTERARVEQKEKERDTFAPGAPEYKKHDEDVTRMKADFNVRMTNLRKDFLDREAKIYYQTYREVSYAVTQYCQRNDIAIAFRFNGEPADPARRESVLGDINKPIVYQNSIDITPDILAMLNAAGGQPGTSPPATGSAPPAVGGRPATGALPPR